MNIQHWEIQHIYTGEKLVHNAVLYNHNGTQCAYGDLYEGMLAQFADVPLVFVTNEAFGQWLQTQGTGAVNKPVSVDVLSLWCVATIRYGKFVTYEFEELLRRQLGPQGYQL